MLSSFAHCSAQSIVPPPGEKAAQNIIKSKYSTGGEAERLKRSHDRRLLAALIRFQCKRGGGGGGAPESASLVRPRYFFSTSPVMIR